MECPALEPVRQGVWDLGVSCQRNVCEVMHVSGQRGHAKFIFELFRLRVERLAS